MLAKSQLLLFRPPHSGTKNSEYAMFMFALVAATFVATLTLAIRYTVTDRDMEGY